VYNETNEAPLITEIIEDNINDGVSLEDEDEFMQDGEDLDILKNIIEEEVEEVWSYENLSPNEEIISKNRDKKNK